jgi:hypothetical protein
VLRAGLGTWVKTLVLAGLAAVFVALHPPAASALPGWLDISTELKFNPENELNFDLDRGMPDDVSFIDFEIVSEIVIKPDDHWHLFVELEGRRRVFVKNRRPETDNGLELELLQVYAEAREIFGLARVRLGRQRIRDRMEWFWDEELDGVMVTAGGPTWLIELAANRDHWFDREFLHPDQSDRIYNYVARLRRKFSGRGFVDGYLFYRNGTRFMGEVPEDIIMLGLQSLAALDGYTRYWLNAAVVHGKGDGPKRHGFGFDVGLIRTFAGPYKPSLIIGLAHGSGDKDPSSGKNRNFRQTGLNDNNATLTGVTPVKYLGEVMEPSLDNIWIATAGFGLRPAANMAIELFYHYYRQAKAAPRLGASNIGATPNGRSPDLGHALDANFGWIANKHVKLEITLGAFWPGRAFGPGADNAYYTNFDVIFAF